MKRGISLICLSFRKNVLPFWFVCFTVFLVLFSKSNLQATKSRVTLMGKFRGSRSSSFFYCD